MRPAPTLKMLPHVIDSANRRRIGLPRVMTRGEFGAQSIVHVALPVFKQLEAFPNYRARTRIGTGRDPGLDRISEILR